MKKYEDLKIKESEIEWQTLQDENSEWANVTNRSERKKESKDEQRRKEAMFEAAEYEDTEFEDIGFGRGINGEQEFRRGKRFPVWILPVVALVVCIPLFLLAQKQDEAREAANKQAESLVASMSGDEQASTEPEAEQSQAAESTEAAGDTEAGESVEATQESEDARGGNDTGDNGNSDENQTIEGSVEDDTTGAGNDDGQTHVSGDATMDFDTVSDVVTAVDATNLRTVPSTEGSGVIIAQLKYGQNVTRTGINEETGWSRVEYFGQVLYAVTQYLTTEVSDAPLIDASDEEPLDLSTITFVECDDYIRPNRRVNLRTEPSTARGAATVRVQVDTNVTLRRTGYTADREWSRVEYNGEILYIANTYVETVTASTQPTTPVSGGDAVQ